jgi:hypothetical protein
MRRNTRREETEAAPSVHDRTPSPRGRQQTGLKAKRTGFPALILGQAAATKTLVEIAVLQPVAVNDLPERALVTDANLGHAVRRLVALSLVRRYRNPAHLDRYLLAIDRRHPLAEPVVAVLHSIADTNNLTLTPSPSPSENLAVVEGPHVTRLRIFGRPPGDVETIFGHPNRTMAILIAGAIGAVDASTIARVVGVRTDGDMHRLLDPLEADGVLTSWMVGSIRLYRLVEASWTPALRGLVEQILVLHPSLASRVRAARSLMLAGGFSNRVHLRRWLGLEPPDGPARPPRRICGTRCTKTTE